jgi:hypothetical protein
LHALPLPIAAPQAPVTTTNRFAPLSEVAVVYKEIFEESPYLKTEKILYPSAPLHRARPSKKRRGKRTIISCTASSSTSSSSSFAEKIPKRSSKDSGQEVTNTPGHGAPCIIYQTITPHSGIPIAFQTIDTLQSDISLTLTNTQVFLDEFLKECHEGVGGFDSGCAGGVGVGCVCWVDLMSEVLGMKAQEGLQEEEVEKERSILIKT